MIIDAAARNEVRRYREAYATRPGANYAFLACCMSTSGCNCGKFHRHRPSPFDIIGLMV